jgi:hypothetical protein
MEKYQIPQDQYQNVLNDLYHVYVKYLSMKHPKYTTITVYTALRIMADILNETLSETQKLEIENMEWFKGSGASLDVRFLDE